MGGLLTSISGQFAKFVLFGTMFPVVIVAGLNLVFVAPLLSFGSRLEERLTRIALGDTTWPVVSLTFVVLVATGLLYNLNIPIIRLYEGYPWKESWVGKWRARRWSRQLVSAAHLRLTLRYVARMLRRDGGSAWLVKEMGDQQTPLALLLNNCLPERETLVLPTRLGNVIRSFERYPSIAYGMDAIPIWPRLVGKIDSAFASTIDEAKTVFDFMINCSFLCALTALAVTVLWMRDSAPLLTPRSGEWAWRVLLFGGLAIVSYQRSIGAAQQWGGQVRSAFDLYRFDLLKQLGYEQKPSSFLEEQAVWKRVTRRLLYPDYAEDLLPYREGPSRIIASPADVWLTAARTMVRESDGLFAVRLTIRNNDTFRRTAQDVRVIEAIPDGYSFVASSLTGSRTIRVSDLKPLSFVLGRIEMERKVEICYRLKPPETK